MDFLTVKLYYPNQWKQSVGDLASNEDKRFNWFLCSKYYKDDSDRYISEISAGTKFYDDKNGINYILPVKAKLLVMKNKNSFNKPSIKTITDIKSDKYQGLALAIKCEKINDIICPEVIFKFSKESIIIDKNQDACPIIRYAKSNYKCIKTKIPKFPSPDQIDAEINNGHSPHVICKILYEYIAEYTELH